MRSYTQNADGSGNDAWSDFLTRFARWKTEMQPYDSATIKVEQTTRGFRLHARPSIAPPAQSSLSIRGEYDPTQVYNTSDIVIISMGSNSGTYFVTSATPITGIAPYTGAPNWAQFPLGQLGAYM